jgi:hypothetical protein
MLTAVPDEMVTTFAIAGTPDDARERLAQMWQYADSMTISPPQYSFHLRASTSTATRS